VVVVLAVVVVVVAAAAAAVARSIICKANFSIGLNCAMCKVQVSSLD